MCRKLRHITPLAAVSKEMERSQIKIEGEMLARCARGNICGQDKNIRRQFGRRADITADSLAAAQGDVGETRQTLFRT